MAQSYTSKMNAKILVLLAIVNIARTRDILVGSKEGGRRIYDENKQANPAIWRQAENLTIAANDDEVISKILITDMRLEKDGEAKIVEGGEGQRNVTIELKSPTVLRGYDFHIEVFAIPDESQKTTGHKVITEKPTIDTNTTTITNLDGHQTSSTTQGPSTTDVNLRHNRDTEAKEKSEGKFIPPALTSTIPSTEASKTPLANIPPTPFINHEMKNEEAEQKFPIVNRGFPQEPPFGHPQVRVYEVNEMPESTARGIPSVNAFSKGYSGDHEDNNTQVPLNMNKMYTHVNYPENNAHDLKHSPSQMANKDSPLIKSEDNKNHRQKRDVNKDNTSAAKIDNQKAIAADKADTVKESSSPKQDEQPIQTINPSSIGIDKHQDHLDAESKSVSNQQGTHNGFHPRQLQRSFTNILPVASSPSPSINGPRNSSPSPVNIEPNQHANKEDVDSKPNEQSEEIPEINHKQRPVTADSVTNAKIKVSEAIKESKRNARDTADKNEFLQPPTLHDPSSTIVPISPKNTLAAIANTDGSNTNGTEVHLNNSSVKSDTIKTPHSNEENERNPKRTNVKNDDKKIDNPLTHFKTNIEATQAKTEIDHASNDTVAEADDKIESPVEPSKKTGVPLKDDIKKDLAKSAENKERLTRDTSSIDKAKHDVKNVPRLAKTKNETVHLKEETSKQLPTTDDKVNLNKVDKTQTPHSHVLEERASEHKTKDINDNKGDQSLKTPSGLINGKDSINSNVGIPLTDIPLATDLKIDAEGKQTSIKELTKTEEKKL